MQNMQKMQNMKNMKNMQSTQNMQNIPKQSSVPPPKSNKAGVGPCQQEDVGQDQLGGQV